MYGFKLAAEVPEQKALAAIKESEEEVSKELKNLASSGSPENIFHLRVWLLLSFSISLLTSFV